jgi:hypothetical protein
MKRILVLLLVLSLFTPVLKVHADDTWGDRYEVPLTSNAKVILYQRGVGKTWYGSWTQGGQALVQNRRISRLTHEQVKLAWQKQFSKCPSDAQIYEVQKGWNDMIVWAEKEGRYEEVVEILSTFSFAGQAPGPIVLTAILNAVSSGATAAIGGAFFVKAMGAIRPSTSNYSGGNAYAAGGEGGEGGSAAAASSSSSSAAAAALLEQQRREQQRRLHGGRQCN